MSDTDMKIKLQSKPMIEGKMDVRFPAKVKTENFLTEAKQNGAVDYMNLAEAVITDPAAAKVALFDEDAGIYNTASVADILSGALPAGGTTGQVLAKQSDDDGDAEWINVNQASSGSREQLSANRTYYVRTDGADSNDGLTNSSGGAFATLQKAVNVALGLDFNGFTVTVQLGNGTYSGQTNIDAPCTGVTGSQRFIIKGDNTTPSNVVLSHSDIALQVLDGADVYLQGVKVTTTGGIASIWVTRGARLWYHDIDFGTAAGFHMWTTDTALSVANGDYTISGGAQVHQDTDTLGIAFPGFSNTVTLTGTPAFSKAFASATIGGVIETSDATYVGSATGPRFSVTQAGIVSTSGGGLNYFPGSSAGSVSSGGSYDTVTGTVGREILSASRTYYVRTDGSDSNDGMSNSSSGAFLSIQAAVNKVAMLDISTQSVTIQVADGTYTGSVTLLPVVGTGTVTLQGNMTTPANVVISTTSSTAIFCPGAGKWTLAGLKVQTTTSGDGISATGSTSLILNKVFFGAVASGWRHMNIQLNSAVQIIASYTISGGGGYHMLAQTGGQISAFTGLTVTLSGTPAFGTAFAAATNVGGIDFRSQTFSGSATGTRYSATFNGVISTGSGASATYFPGSTNGSIATGGQYS